MIDATMVFFGINMGDSHTHDNGNLRIVLAGSGFRHGQHLAFKCDDNAPLCNLSVTMFRQLDIETESFGSGDGILTGLAA